MAVILMACNDINAEQYRLTAGCNMPRGGDQVTMEVMSNPQAVRIGGNVLWDFSRLRLAERDMPLRHVSRGDSVLVRVEGRENSTLQLSGKGWQLASSRDLDRYLNYPLPERLMALPMAYGDTASGFFYGEGMADGVRFLRQQGETRVEALASAARASAQAGNHRAERGLRPVAEGERRQHAAQPRLADSPPRHRQHNPSDGGVQLVGEGIPLSHSGAHANRVVLPR